MDSGVAGLSATAGVDERRAVAISTLEVLSREVVESHLLTHILFAPWCRACIAAKAEVKTLQQPRRSFLWTIFSGLTDSATGGHHTHACSV